MSQFTVPKVEIDPKRFDFTNTPEFQNALNTVRESTKNVHGIIANGQRVEANLKKALENPPRFELQPEIKASLQDATTACATASEAIQEGKRLLEELTSKKTATSPEAQAAMKRINAGFAHIEQVAAATRMPPLKVN